MEKLAKLKGIDYALMVSWLSCTFVYMLSQDASAFTAQFAQVRPDLTIDLSGQYRVTKEEYGLLLGMYKPAAVFAPGYTVNK